MRSAPPGGGPLQAPSICKAVGIQWCRHRPAAHTHATGGAAGGANGSPASHGLACEAFGGDGSWGWRQLQRPTRQQSPRTARRLASTEVVISRHAAQSGADRCVPIFLHSCHHPPSQPVRRLRSALPTRSRHNAPRRRPVPAACRAAEVLEWRSPLQVLKYPDPGLRAVNARVGVFDESLTRLAAEMFDVMYQCVVPPPPPRTVHPG